MKLLETQDYLLFIDEKAEIKEGNYRVHIYEKTLNHPFHRLEHGENTFDTWKLVLAYYPFTKEAKELDLPELPPFEENIEILWSDFNKNHNRNCPLGKEQFVRAINYKAAQSKQFSLEDMNKAIAFGFGICRKEDRAPFNLEIIEFIQSLSTQQLPKEFKPIMVCGRCLKPDDDDEDCWSAKECSRNTDFPDKFKTITNSEGKQEIQGKYIW